MCTYANIKIHQMINQSNPIYEHYIFSAFTNNFRNVRRKFSSSYEDAFVHTF